MKRQPRVSARGFGFCTNDCIEEKRSALGGAFSNLTWIYSSGHAAGVGAGMRLSVRTIVQSSGTPWPETLNLIGYWSLTFADAGASITLPER